MTFTLRRVLSAALVGLALLSAAASLTLVLVSRGLHRATLAMGAEVERQEAAEDSLRDLLLHDRARAPGVREKLARDSLERLERLERDASDDEQRGALRSAIAAVSDHFTSADASDAAEEALEEVARVERARVAERRSAAERLHATARWIGVSTAVVVAAGTALLVAGVYLRIGRPLLDLARGVSAFSTGSTGREPRLPERGPFEIAEIARAFNALADRLEAQAAAHRTYLLGVVHDLRNPVHVLRGAVAVGLENDDDASAKRMLAIVERKLGLLERLVSDILDTESLRAGKLRLRLADHDLRDICLSVESLYRGVSPRHDVEVIGDPSPIVVRCDGARLEQVVTNLVSNAVKYSPSGGAVTIVPARRDDRALIHVVDHGIGMTSDQVRRMFDPFARGSATKDTIPGRGLGLFVAKQIVEGHGGTISVDSAPGEGSTFTVELPLPG